MKTNVYIDGFNLYYGCVKGTPYRWLNILKLCQIMLPPDKRDINRIRYFTSEVDPRPDDPGNLQRQRVYIRALRTLPNVSIHFGQFATHKVWRPSANPSPVLPSLVRVLDTKEKGSDVNLATFLLVDGYERDYEAAVVISNDSDLVLPITMVREKLDLRVGIINPHKRANRELHEAASFYRRIEPRALSKSLFPDVLAGEHGIIRKPDAW